MPAGLVDKKGGVRAWRNLRCDFGEVEIIASVLQRGMTSAAPLPSLGQIAPKI